MDSATLGAIAQIGFPAVIAVYLLYWLTRSLNGKFDRLAAAVESNTEAVKVLSEAVNARPKTRP